jgi:hypothetical protein
MLQKIKDLKDCIGTFDREAGFFYQNFLTEDQTSQALEEALKVFDSAPPHSVDGMVGIAYEKYEDVYVCPRQKELIPSLNDAIEERIFTHPKFSLYAEKWCASLVKFDKLSGMTSHRDYSYNKNMLGTLVLDGNVLFGSSISERDDAYSPSNTVLAGRGDLIGLKVPERNDEGRPFFSIISPNESTLLRIWMRDRIKCPSCRGGYNG